MLSAPLYKLTYDKSATKLFNTGYNIKSVWDKNGIIFENGIPNVIVQVSKGGDYSEWEAHPYFIKNNWQIEYI